MINGNVVVLCHDLTEIIYHAMTLWKCQIIPRLNEQEFMI